MTLAAKIFTARHAEIAEWRINVRAFGLHVIELLARKRIQAFTLYALHER
jgi:hypothetical protein